MQQAPGSCHLPRLLLLTLWLLTPCLPLHICHLLSPHRIPRAKAKFLSLLHVPKPLWPWGSFSPCPFTLCPGVHVVKPFWKPSYSLGTLRSHQILPHHRACPLLALVSFLASLPTSPRSPSLCFSHHGSHSLDGAPEFSIPNPPALMWV